MSAGMEITAGQLFKTLFTILVFGVPTVIYFLEKRVKKLTPSDLIPIPPATEIISLRIYPIKSCRGIEVSSAKLLKTGLDLDRNWMFIDTKENKFQTIRQQSRMTLINTAIDWETDELIISAKAKKDDETLIKLVVPAHPTVNWLKDNTIFMDDAKIWADVVDAYMYNESLTKPFADFLDKSVRLVYKGPTPRLLRGNGDAARLGRTEATKFADLAPVQVANIRSLNELNRRLIQQGEDAITVERFRPNIIVAGQDAWGEDVWKTLKISPRSKGRRGEKQSEDQSITMDAVARCARCQVPNVDPDTAVKSKNQPWETLMSYRRVDAGITYKPCFGMLCCPREEGLINVGAKFEVTEVTADHEYVKGF